MRTGALATWIRQKQKKNGFSWFYVTILWRTRQLIYLQEHPMRYITQVHINHITFHIAVTHGLRMNILKVSKFTHQLIACWYSYECILMWFGWSSWFNCLFTPRSDRVPTYWPYAATSTLPYKEFAMNHLHHKSSINEITALKWLWVNDT